MSRRRKSKKVIEVNNLRLQFGEYATSEKIEVRSSPIQGIGVYCIKPIEKEERIIEYLGERITPDEGDDRYDDDSMDRHHTFLFEVDEHVCIDAGRVGNDARFINHSCQPNCEAVNEDDRIFVEALRDIEPGEELTYDYAYEHEGELTEELRRQYMCLCGSPECRGTILKVKPPRRRQKKTKKRSSAA